MGSTKTKHIIEVGVICGDSEAWTMVYGDAPAVSVVALIAHEINKQGKDIKMNVRVRDKWEESLILPFPPPA